MCKISMDKYMIDLKEYQRFVEFTTSAPSTYYVDLQCRLKELALTGCDVDVKIPQLITSAFGLTAESGEYSEVVKKIIFQGKPLNEENIFHMKRELGDICWYLSVACTALGTTLEEVIEMNFEKLSARYPEGFSIEKSENRKEGDV